MVEWFIKTDEHLPKVVTLHQRDWDTRIPIFLLAYRASTHDTMGLTSANPVFRGELCLPCDLLHDFHNYAHQLLRLASEGTKTYDHLAKCWGYQENDQVWS
jgi:hypothetical protein